MGSTLINVRLDDARLRKARRLRETGVSLSDVVREAIDRRYDALSTSLTGRDAVAAVTGILERFPDPPGAASRSYDVHDRRAAAAAIVRTLKRRTR
jgi:hypothetical protein